MTNLYDGMRRIAHIINPFVVDKASDQYVAQPITFETMRIARDFARGQVNVALFSAHFPEDRSSVPGGFQLLPDLDRSILDIGTFQKKRKLPLLVDILDRLYEASDAEYFIYTNVDIALMPHFYVAVNRLIEAGHESFVINRRTIPGHYKSVDEIPLMYAEIGKPHEGHDCFVFKRDMHKKNKLGTACIGMPFFNRILIFNFACHAKSFKQFKRMHLTFHIGNYVAWQGDDYFDYVAHNKMEFVTILRELEKGHGSFDRNGPLAPYLIDDISGGNPIDIADGEVGRKVKGRVFESIASLIKRPTKIIPKSLFGISASSIRRIMDRLR